MSHALLATLCSLLVTHCTADRAPFHANSKYNHGDYGDYVTQTFKSNPEVTAVPVVNFMKPFTSCDDGSYLMICPRGDAADSTPMILDVNGSPVWASTQRYGQVYNLQVQTYKDHAYLTFWGGDDTVGGHGNGQYFMLDQQYQERFRIAAANGLGADLHVFTITNSDTALISIYDKKIAELNSVLGHYKRGWIWDAIFQELDIETGRAVFEWRANDHVDPAESYTAVNDAAEDWPWDVYHLNSVEKDEVGNYLVSCRYLRALLYIDGKTGDVLWQLGGKKNSFKDLSRGKATTFLGQHDAHFLKKDGKSFVTFFDNNADWDHAMDDQSKGTRVELDLEAMTAKLDVAMYDPTTKILSTSQGSYQTLPNGHVVLGYGFNGAMAEFSEDGKLLCDAYFQPASKFGSGGVQSYRNLRFNWTAYPSTAPNLALDNDILYVSWNGATEVATWLLVDSDGDDERHAQEPESSEERRRAIENAILIPKMGFETEYQILPQAGLQRFVRIVALDHSGQALRSTNLLDIGGLATANLTAEIPSEDEQEQGAFVSELADHRILIALGGMAGLSLTMLMLSCFKRRGEKSSEHVYEPVNGGEGVLQGERGGRMMASGKGMLEQVRNFWHRRQQSDDWADVAAAEGLLTEEESRVIAMQIPVARRGSGVYR